MKALRSIFSDVINFLEHYFKRKFYFERRILYLNVAEREHNGNSSNNIYIIKLGISMFNLYNKKVLVGVVNIPLIL